MATTARRGARVKRREFEAQNEPQAVVRDQIEELARAGAQPLLLAALEDEVNVYVQRDRYQRQAEFRGLRRAEHLTTSTGAERSNWLRRPPFALFSARFESRRRSREGCKVAQACEDTYSRVVRVHGVAAR